MLKDVADTGGLKVLSMYVRNIRIRHVKVVETKGPTDMFATMWAVKMLNFLGLSDIILQCDPEVITHKVGRNCQIQKNRANSHSKFSQTVTSKQWRSRKLSETVAGTSANNTGSNARTHTQYRPSADNALMRWIVRHAAWLIPRFRGSDVQSPFYRAMGGPYRGKLVEFGETVLAPSRDRKNDLEIQHQSWADRWKSGV